MLTSYDILKKKRKLPCCVTLKRMPLVIKTASDLRAPCDVASSGFAGAAKTGEKKGKKQLTLCAAAFDDLN